MISFVNTLQTAVATCKGAAKGCCNKRPLSALDAGAAEHSTSQKGVGFRV